MARPFLSRMNGSGPVYLPPSLTSPGVFLRYVPAFVSGAAVCTEAVSRHLLPSKPSRTRIDAFSFKSTSKRLYVETFSVGMQQWSRGLLNPVDNPLGATGFECHSTCVDISSEILEIAQKGLYSLRANRTSGFANL